MSKPPDPEVERLKRRDTGTRAEVLRNKKAIEDVRRDLRDHKRQAKEDLAGISDRVDRVEKRIGVPDYVCHHCGAVGQHYAPACSRR